MELNFITTNDAKVKWLKSEFNFLKFDIEIKSPFVKIIEPQADDFNEVSISKAKQAYDAIKKPVIVEDGGFCIPSLDGFPGVYTKYINQTIGNKGLLKLIDDKNDRNAYFTTVASFVDGDLIKTFERRIEGTITLKESDELSKFAWSNLWKIFIPNGYNKTLSEMSEQEIHEYQNSSKNKQSSLSLFAKWYVNEHKQSIKY
ncbi:MAG: Non-canonical purine NTP pyrophosphatase [Alphaproteobacteria bacterium ADurb.Bin438]|nr:MAG: Non-canonical purine NTP pyrophosphatase [Alphaproteobacteria bacterium ADurb.Bin438]